MKRPQRNLNVFLAVICVALFALTAPFTRIAVLAITPRSIILLRILGAALVCAVYLAWDVLRHRWFPPRQAWPGIGATMLGTVIGFNSLMAYGLQEVPAGHAAVALSGLPMVTAIYSVFRDRLRPSISFWSFALLGTLLSGCFFLIMNVERILMGDVLLLLAVLVASFGYVEGGRTSRIHGGARTMSWAVVLSLPICLPLALWHFQNTTDSLGGLNSWVIFSVAYVGLISQSLGMFLWFTVLARGPMEKIAMVQLLQPFFTLAGAIVLLGETVLPITWLIASMVAVCVMGTHRERQKVVAKQIRSVT